MGFRRVLPVKSRFRRAWPAAVFWAYHTAENVDSGDVELAGGKRISAEIGKLAAAVEPADRRLLLVWGGAAGLAVAVWAAASALAAGVEPSPVQVASSPDPAASASIEESLAAKLEARNAQLLRAIVTLSEDSDAMRSRLAELEKQLKTLAEIPELAGRISRMEGEVAHIAATMPFARTTRTTTVALTVPEPLAPPPTPAQAPSTAGFTDTAEAAPSPAQSIDSTAAGSPSDSPARVAVPGAAPAVASAEAANAPADPDPIETASIPEQPLDVIGEGDAMEPEELQQVQIALADPAPPANEPPAVAKPVRPPIPTPRPPQVATRTVFGVDLGRFDSIAKVQSRWQALTKKDPDLVKPLKPMVATRQGAGGQETYLVAGPFSDAGAAAVACAKFKALGATCRTTRYAGEQPLRP
jgi:hypothetical protein